MNAIVIKSYAKEPLSVLKAIAISLARDIDRGQEDLRGELERVMAAIPDAKMEPRWS